MLRHYLLCCMAVTMMFIGSANAGPPPKGDTNTLVECPDATKSDVEAEFGPGSSEATTCLQVRKGVKSVASWNSSAVNGRTGFGQQPQSTRNLTNNYDQMYGMVANQDYKVAVVAFSGGGRWALNDEAYNRTYGVTTGNPSADITTGLIEKGIPVYLCQNTMRGNNWSFSDVLPGVLMVPTGVGGVVDFQSQGYTYLVP